MPVWLISASAVLAAAIPLAATIGGPKLTNGRRMPLAAPAPEYLVYGNSVGRIPVAEALSQVQWAFAQWAAIETATVPEPEYGGRLQNQVIEDRKGLESFLARATAPSAVIFASEDLMRNLTGLPRGSRDPFWGTTYPFLNEQGQIRRFVIVFGPEAETNLRSIALHETGHAIGLDHSQWGLTRLQSYLPIMWPLSVPRATLSSDDESWASFLYPGKLRNSRYVRLHGKVTRGTPNGVVPLIGQMNVVARALKVDTERRPLELYRYSCVVDFQMAGTGEYEIWVEPGDYEVAIEPIDPGFYGTTSVGPYGPGILSGLRSQPVGRFPIRSTVTHDIEVK
jgi:hypothetical protein